MTSAEPIFASDALAGLSGAHWFDYVRHVVPADQTPWVWIAPDSDDAPAMVGWGERARFEASGHASVSTAWQAFQRWAHEHGETGALAFGSFPFAPDHDGFLVVPQVLILRRHLGDPTWVWGMSASDLARNLVAVDEGAGAAKVSSPSSVTVSDDVTQDQWRTQVNSTVQALRAASAATQQPFSCAIPPHLSPISERAESDNTSENLDTTLKTSGGVSEIEAGERHIALEKVVLARSVTASSSQPLSQLDTAASLVQTFPVCWLYADDGLVGASPELLVDCRDGFFRCRVLAGTRKPAWVHELFEDPKERHEHELAVASVMGRLAEAGVMRPTLRGPYLLELPNVTHLATDITALVGQLDAARIVDAIHPTAAVCGTPREAAFEHLCHTESIDRGRFAGPVGWMSVNGSGQWALALRCGQFAPDNYSVRVFAGAGIMPGSDPEKEWTETGAKMEAFLSGLR